MKLTFEEKKEIYRKHCAWIGKRELSRQYHIRLHNIHYLLEIADRYGTSRLKHGRNRKYPVLLKEEMINRVYQGESIEQVSLDMGLPTSSLLGRWLREYQENGGMIIAKKRGKPPMVKKKPKKTEEPGSTEEQLRKAQEELEYLRAENAYLKKLKALVQERQARERGKKPKQ